MCTSTGASKSLPAAAAVSISWILSVFLILTTLRPLISPSDSFQAPRGQHGSAKTSVYTQTTNTRCSSAHTLPFTTQMYTKISSSQHPAISAIRNFPAWLIQYCRFRFKREWFTQHANMTYLTSELTEGKQEANFHSSTILHIVQSTVTRRNVKNNFGKVNHYCDT